MCGLLGEVAGGAAVDPVVGGVGASEADRHYMVDVGGCSVCAQVCAAPVAAEWDDVVNLPALGDCAGFAGTTTMLPSARTSTHTVDVRGFPRALACTRAFGIGFDPRFGSLWICCVTSACHCFDAAVVPFDVCAIHSTFVIWIGFYPIAIHRKRALFALCPETVTAAAAFVELC